MVTNCWNRQVQIRCSTPTSTQHCGWNCTVSHGHADKMASSHAVVTLCGPVPARLCIWPSSLDWFHTAHNCISSMPCMSNNVMVWQTCFPETNHSAPIECTHLLILRPFPSTSHTCTSFHVSNLFGSCTQTEQGITLTLLVTHEMSLLGLCVRHLSGNVISYW